MAPTLEDKVELARMASHRVRPLRGAARPARRARRRPVRGDGAVRRAVRRLPRAYGARPTGSRAWSRPTSGTGWPPTSTARSRRSSTPTPATIIVESLADAGQSAFVVDRVRAAIAAGPPGRRPARAVGPPADGGGAVPGPAGRRRAGRARRAARRRRGPARRSTWPRSAGCSPGSPRTTPSGWRSSASPPERLGAGRRRGGPRRGRRQRRVRRPGTTVRGDHDQHRGGQHRAPGACVQSRPPLPSPPSTPP